MTPGPATALAATYLKLVAVAVLYGGQYVAGRLLAPHVGGATAGALRYVLAAATMVLVFAHLRARWTRLSLRDWRPMILLGAFGVFLFNVLFFAGLEHITASRAVLLGALSTVAVALASRVVFGTHLDALRWVGIVLATLGVAVVVSDGDLGRLLDDAVGIGDVYVLLSMAAWVTYTLMTRVVMRRFEPMQTVAFPLLAGTPMLVAAAVVDHPWQAIADLPLSGWLSVLYLGTIATVLASFWFLQGVQRIGPTRAAAFMNLVPVFGVLFGWWLLGEPLLASVVVGGMLVVVGVALTNRSSAH